jgi:glycosyltransferase involved in cell wall biosynthesis
MGRWWFNVFLVTARAVGLKVVWTVHNVLPHEPVFDNDLAARKLLTRQTDAVIALSDTSAKEIVTLFNPRRISVIPHGPLRAKASTVSRGESRTKLDLDSRICFSFFGNLRPYKGVEVLISAAAIIGPQISVRIAGRGPTVYVDFLLKTANRANAAGADVRVDPRWYSEDELADFLTASDVCVFPFKKIDNSGSIILALHAGVPVIIPDFESLNYIDERGVFRYNSTEPISGLASMMSYVSSMSREELAAHIPTMRGSVGGTSWDEIAKDTIALYADIVRGG